jgi:Zn ribbon nucleic-acid-binding protein
MIKTFIKGHSTFRCEMCDKLTRKTMNDNVNDCYCVECIKKMEKENEEMDNRNNGRPSDKKCTICGSPCVWIMTEERIEVLQCTKHKNHQSIFGFIV